MLQARPLWLAERSGEQAAIALAHAAGAPCPPVHADARTEAEPTFSALLNQLQAMLIPGSIIYIISDFMDLTPVHRPALARLAANNALFAVHIVDPAEQHLPRVGRVRLQSADGRVVRLLDTRASSTRQHYQQQAAQHFAQRQQVLQGLNISYTRLSTPVDAIEDVIPF
jgi:uncharacterized protein (DUF58 family)